MQTMETGQHLDMSPDEFRKAGGLLVEQIARFMEALPDKKVTTAESPSALRAFLPQGGIPEYGRDINELLLETTDLLTGHSLFNGHPRFWGYITSSAAPIGALAELLAASVNPNVGAQTLSPMATEIERQTIQWLSEFIGYKPGCGGIFVSGGNMANFVGYLTARKVKACQNTESAVTKAHTVYCAHGTHTWIQKAVDLFGQGSDKIRWVETSPGKEMRLDSLAELLEKDLRDGYHPFMVIGNAGTVETGSVDKLQAIGTLCRKHRLWFHIDGAYGAPAAALPELKSIFSGLGDADSIAIDPHKWLYSPLEAGCVLVREAAHLKATFSHNPVYYNFEGSGEDQPLNYHEYGLQNSRGFRALKVWLSLRQIGKQGMIAMIRKDIRLAEHLHLLVGQRSELEAISCHLSISTFRYLPTEPDLRQDPDALNVLNRKLLDELQRGGEVFLSNAIVNEAYCLRVCIVNFRTTAADLEFLVTRVIAEGKKLEASHIGSPE